MSTPSVRFRSLAAAGVLVAALGACDDDPLDTADPAESDVLLDVHGDLEATPFAVDTLNVRVPQGRVMGVILETDVPIVMRYGAALGQVVHSGFGGAFAAIVPQATGERQLLVGRSQPEVVPVEYRIRILAVDDAPEHTDAEVEPGDGFHTEWIEPALDRDVFTFELDDGEEFVVDFESLDEDVRLTARVMPPAGAGYYLFLEAGPELTRSEVHAAVTSGEHRIIVYSAGLMPDVTAEYRFRVLTTD